MKVFYQIGSIKAVAPNNGAAINEINNMCAIARFAEVHHAGQPFFPDEPNFGLEDYPESILSRIEDEHYDLYIVRNNPKLFMQLPHPKIYFATPHQPDCFDDADYLFTPTSEWTRRLHTGEQIGSFPPLHYPNSFTMHQTIHPTFKPLQDDPKTKKIREEIGAKHIIGCFGGFRKSCFPYSFLALLPELRERVEDVRVVFSDTRGMNDITILERPFPFEDMPYALSACDLLLYNVRIPDGEIAGSLKVIEAMATGTPVISPRFKAREEELGADYELFHEFEENNGRYGDEIEAQLISTIIIGLLDERLRKRLRERLVERAKYFSIEESAKRLETIFNQILNHEEVLE